MFSPADQTGYLCKQCRSWWDGSYRTVSSGSTLFAILLWFLTGIYICYNGQAKFNGWKSISSLRKHAYSSTCILKISPSKTENFQIKTLIFFIFLLKNINCGYSLEPPRWGGSNKYPQSMFLSRNKKNNVYPCKPQFYYMKVGFKGIKII